MLAYLHYQPTYYHLHVHFVHIEKQGRDSRESLPLEQVIFNIELAADYYQRVPLVYAVGSLSPLFNVLTEHGVLLQEEKK